MTAKRTNYRASNGQVPFCLISAWFGWPLVALRCDSPLGDGPDGAANEAPPQATIVEAFQHYACLYIKYIQILSRLSVCYDQMVHPQKRIDVKQVIEVVATRVVELKHLLVKWNPPNPDVMTQPGRSFPWEYVNLDDILVDLKLPPETLEIPVPQSFLDDQQEDLVRRERLVKGYMKLKHGVNAIPLDAIKVAQAAIAGGVGVLSLDEAIAVIQRNERGRQGRQRGQTYSKKIARQARLSKQSSKPLDDRFEIREDFESWFASCDYALTCFFKSM